MGLIYLEKKSIAEIPPASGSVSDTLNVKDKITNAPSIRLVEDLIETVSGSIPVEIPTKTSQLENDSGFITIEDIPEDEDDGLLIDSIIGWDGDEIPEGYEEVEIETGTIDYEELINKPKIEGVELKGDKTLEDLKIQALTNLELEELINSQV